MEKGETKIRVNGSTWRIVLTDDKNNLRDNIGHICKGITSYKNSTVYIDIDISRDNMIHIIRHELSHIYLYETQIKSSLLKDDIIYSEEDLCEFLAIYGSRIINKSNNILRKLGI